MIKPLKAETPNRGQIVWHKGAWVHESPETQAHEPKDTGHLPVAETEMRENEPQPKMPAYGWTMREAFRHLFPEIREQFAAAALRKAEMGGTQEDKENFLHYRDIVWKMMAKLIESGVVVATGLAPGEITRNTIDPSLALSADPDLSNDCLQLGDIVFQAVRLVPAVNVETAPDGNGAQEEKIVQVPENRARGTVPRGRRGPDAKKTRQTANTLLFDLRSGKRTVDSLTEKRSALACELGVSRDTLNKALTIAVSEFETPTNPDK